MKTLGDVGVHVMLSVGLVISAENDGEDEKMVVTTRKIKRQNLATNQPWQTRSDEVVHSATILSPVWHVLHALQGCVGEAANVLPV